MNIFVILTISSMFADLMASETTKEPTSTKDGQKLNRSGNDILNLQVEGSNPRLNSLWVVRPATNSQESPLVPEELTRRVVWKPAHSLTRLAKTLTLGFDPFFSKGYFGPFERRPKPVTLVAFRKNGLLPRSKTRKANGKSAEIAELQSPFNDVSNFWVDD